MTSTGEVRSPIRFGAFELDLDSGELRKHRVRIKLQDQPFQILKLLLEHPGEVVTREELKRRLWATDTFVDFDRGLNKAINRLRDALGDSADQPRFIRTLPKRGYRFIGSVEGARPLNPTIPPVAEQPRPGTSSPATGNRRPLKWWVALAAGLAAIAVVAYFAIRQRSPFAETDTVVLADFDNRTGDPAFDDTLRQALAVDLGQSPYLRIISDQEVREMLRSMKRNPDQKLNGDLARELCQRAGGKVVIGGSITTLGAEYVVGVTAINCPTGGFVFQDQVRAKRKEETLSGLNAAASRLRRKLGESLASIQRFDAPTFRGVSTRSFEAFRAWEEASRTARISRVAAIPFDLRAIELDPDFASAHAGLAILYNAAGEATLSARYARKAWELRGQVSEPEKFLITAQYYLSVTGELEKIPPLCRVWSETYPNSFVPHERAAYAYIRLGQFDNANAEFQRARQFGEDTLVVEPMTSVDIALDRLPNARVRLENSLSRNPDNLGFRQLLYRLSFLEGDSTGMQNQVVWAKNKSDVSLVFLQAATEAYFGRLKRSRELTNIATESARHGDFLELAATRQAVMALHEAEFGYPEFARQQARAALEMSAGKFVRSWAALALAQAKETAEARKLADQLNSEFPTDTLVQNYWVPTIRAEIELTAGNATRALELLRAGEPYELSAVADQYRGGGPMLPVETRGRAYLLAGDGQNAIREFQKILQHRGLIFNNPEGVLARLGLARAYALTGDRVMSRATYKEVLELWKDADSDSRVIKEVQAEYAG